MNQIKIIDNTVKTAHAHYLQAKMNYPCMSEEKNES